MCYHKNHIFVYHHIKKPMKTKFITSIVLFTLCIVLFSFTENNKDVYQNSTSIEFAEIPENVKSILDNKCMGCHSNQSKVGKSKSKFNIDKIIDGSYSTGKLASKYGKIGKSLSENKMPPKKFLAKYPNKELTPEESKIITDWATEQKLKLNKE